MMKSVFTAERNTGETPYCTSSKPFGQKQSKTKRDFYSELDSLNRQMPMVLASFL
jgi:hypothetical protein